MIFISLNCATTFKIQSSNISLIKITNNGKFIKAISVLYYTTSFLFSTIFIGTGSELKVLATVTTVFCSMVLDFLTEF